MTASCPVKVLIADDDAPTRILLRAAISQWGYSVVEAGDGEEAWKILQQPDVDPPQLMIVDWLMPKLDGIDLCRRIKNELKAYPYIILLTQLSGTTNIVKGLEAGANEFLSKPFNMAELQSRLSVGRRIIQYGQALAEKNDELKSYFNEAGELAGALNEMNVKMKAMISPDNMSDMAAQIKALQGLQEELQKVTDKMSELCAGHQSKSGDGA